MKKTVLLAVSLLVIGCSARGSSDAGSKTGDEAASVPAPVVKKENFSPKKYVEVILDASGSMGADTDGEKRIVTAKKMLNLIVQSLQEEQAAVALTAFGHRKSWSCNDIEQIFDMGFKSTEDLAKRVDKIQPAERGKTPIAKSLMLAHERLKKIKGPKGIVVITDGEETCGGDPCKVAKQLREEMDVQVYTLAYDVKNTKELKSLSCLGETKLAKNREELFTRMGELKASLDKDYARKMEGLESVQTLRVLGPQRDAWVTAKSQVDGKDFRFLGVMGTSLPVGRFDVTVHYNPIVTYKDIDLKEKEKKTITVVGEGALVLELDFPGLELEAVNMLDSKKYRVTAGKEAKVPTGRYNVYGMTASGLAFQWLDQTVTPNAIRKLNLPNWSLLEVRTGSPLTFDLFAYNDGAAPKTASRGNFRKEISTVKQYKDSLGFYPTNAPHIVEPGDYTLILSDGKVIKRVQIGKGERKIEIVR